jgi:membrane-anchored glycerophosphoryl diester phosphodiesterase (GDPDase)
VLLIACLYVFLLALFFAPMLYLYARWFVAIPALLAEDLGPVAALRRSWQLSRDSIWRNIFYVVLLFIISSVVLGLPLTILQSVGSIFGAINASVGGLLYAVSIGLGFIVSIIWQPFAAVAAVLLYYDLRVRHESYDLQLRVEQLESQTAGAPAQA